MTRYAVRHETRYRYDTPVDLGMHMLRLAPAALPRQTVRTQKLSIEPEPARLVTFSDHFGNVVHEAAVETSHDHFAVTFEAEVDVEAVPDKTARLPGEAWDDVRAAMNTDGFAALPDIAEFAYGSPLAPIDEAATAYAARSFPAGRPVGEAVEALNARIHRDFAYRPNRTNISTSVGEVFELGEGVCQDFAHVMISGLRGLGLPARYVSGYIRTRTAPGQVPQVGADASHAWVSAWCGEAIGWVEFDPTNDVMVSDQHIVIAYGRDFSDVTPLRGVILGGGNHTLSVGVSVVEIENA